MGFPHINVRNVAAFSIKSQLFLVTKGWPWSGYHRKDGRNGPVPVPRAGHCCTSGETGPGKLAKELKRLGHLLKYPPAPHRLQVSVEINYFRSDSYVKSMVFYSTAMKYDSGLGSTWNTCFLAVVQVLSFTKDTNYSKFAAPNRHVRS